MEKIVNNISFNSEKIKTFDFEKFKEVCGNWNGLKGKNETQLMKIYEEITGIKAEKKEKPEKAGKNVKLKND